MKLSVIIPALDEAARIERAVASTRDPMVLETIVADGGSSDATAERARAAGARVIVGTRGRAYQMNAAARVATGDVLLFLHADTTLPHGFGQAIVAVIASGSVGGRFDVQIESARRATAVVAGFMNRRSRLSGIFTGDQAMFVRRAVFEVMGGFAPMPLMEDLEFARRLRRRGHVAALRQRVRTSGRRWESCGVTRTILRMWTLRAAFYLGFDPHDLARRYRQVV